jgi:hypothetical protein
MAAQPPVGEEIATAVPPFLSISCNVGIVFPTEIHCEFGKGYSVWLLGISLGFLDFTN